MSVASATSIMAFAPAGSGVVDMIVTTPSGTSTAHSADHFTFVGSPSEPVITGPARRRKVLRAAGLWSR